MSKIIEFIKDYKRIFLGILILIIVISIFLISRKIQKVKEDEDINEAEEILESYEWDESLESEEVELDETQSTIYEDLNYGIE